MSWRPRVRAILSLLAAGRRSPFRPIVESVRFSQMIRRLRPSVRELRAITAPDQIDFALLARIHAAWGNRGWSADPGFLHDLAVRVSTAQGNLLDCGSGLSTIVCAALAARNGAVVYSLEQDERWFRYMGRAIRALGLSNVVLWYTPLRSYGDFVWFDLTGRTLPAAFSCVSCDGPSVGRRPWSPEEHANWRVGVVLVLNAMKIRFDEVVLDDAEDDRSPGVIERWRREGLDPLVVQTATGHHIVARPRHST